MNHNFAKAISTLRKGRGITQKLAAADLGVSQALLSHYEKGIRECGLDFLVKISEYYGVSCDYLLGRDMLPFSVHNTNCADLSTEHQIANVLDITNNLICRLGNEHIRCEVQSFLTLSVYRMLRIICQFYSLDKNLFNIDSSIYQQLSAAEMQFCEVRVKTAAAGTTGLTIDQVAPENSDYSKSLFSVISSAERILSKRIQDN